MRTPIAAETAKVVELIRAAVLDREFDWDDVQNFTFFRRDSANLFLERLENAGIVERVGRTYYKFTAPAESKLH